MDESEKQQKPWRHKRKHSAKKKWLVIGVVAIVLIAGGVGGWLFISGQKLKTQSIVARTSEQLGQVAIDANTLVEIGDTSGAKTTYEKAIKQTSGATQKVVLLIGDASIYFDEGNYDKALTIAKQAESIKLDENVAAFIAGIYRVKGDKQNAITYYQTAISMANKADSASDRSSYYQNEIDILNGTGN